MNLRPRLTRLERAVKAAAVCPVCAGAGRTSLQVVIEGVPPRPSPGCTRCGKVGAVRRINVEVPQEACA